MIGTYYNLSMLLILYLGLFSALRFSPILDYRKHFSRSFSSGAEDIQSDKTYIKKAMENARINSKTNTSPGAGLLTAEEQSEAAYADLINTTMDQRFQLNIFQNYKIITIFIYTYHF